MAALKDKMAREAKREKKKRREMKVKARLRAAQAAQAEGIADDPAEVGRRGMGWLRGMTWGLGHTYWDLGESGAWGCGGRHGRLRRPGGDGAARGNWGPAR